MDKKTNIVNTIVGKVLTMIKINPLNEIRDSLSDRHGCRIVLRENGGRRKSKEHIGVLERTYESIFTVSVEDAGEMRLLSYTYSDILTKAVELFLKEPDASIAE